MERDVPNKKTAIQLSIALIRTLCIVIDPGLSITITAIEGYCLDLMYDPNSGSYKSGQKRGLFSSGIGLDYVACPLQHLNHSFTIPQIDKRRVCC